MEIEWLIAELNKLQIESRSFSLKKKKGNKKDTI